MITINITELYIGQIVYIDDLKVGDIVTIIGTTYGSMDDEDKNKKYIVESIKPQEPCLGCSNYGYCMSLKEKTLFGLGSHSYAGIACHYILGNDKGVRLRKREDRVMYYEYR